MSSTPPNPDQVSAAAVQAAAQQLADYYRMQASMGHLAAAAPNNVTGLPFLTIMPAMAAAAAPAPPNMTLAAAAVPGGYNAPTSLPATDVPPRRSRKKQRQLLRGGGGGAAAAAAAPPRPRGRQPKPVPRPPSWVRGDPFLDKREKVVAAAKRNAKIVEQANKAGARYDFVLYGDSITQYVGDQYMDVWKQHFGHLGRSAPLGVGGNTVEELSFRLTKGREKFAVGPRVVAVLIGVNNLRSSKNDPAPLLDEFLVPYIRAIWPDTTLLLLGILPVESHDVRPYNAKYKQIAQKHGAVYLSCGDIIDPRNKRDMPDGVHPSPSGYNKFYPCLRRAVDEALAASVGGGVS